MPGKSRKEEKIARFGFLLLAPAVFLIDLCVKDQIVRRYAEGRGTPVWEGVFHLTRVDNTGAAFGMLKDRTALLVGFTALAALALAVFFVRHLGLWGGSERPEAYGLRRAGWALLAGGALGNLYDRLARGYVVDYLDFRVWPVFNLSDAAICVGAGLAILSYILYRHASDPV